MRTLAIDCATEACSVALFDDDSLIAGEMRLLGRGHAEQLVPMIAALPGKGRAGRIAVSLGPGSFTGLRVGLAAGRALALAWGAQVVGYPCLALVAAMAREQRLPTLPDAPLAVAMTGGHGEWFVQSFGSAGMATGEATSLPPEAAAGAIEADLVAGTRAAELVALRGHGEALPILPDARAFPLLDPRLLSDRAELHYGRPPDARLPTASAP